MEQTMGESEGSGRTVFMRRECGKGAAQPEPSQ